MRTLRTAARPSRPGETGERVVDIWLVPDFGRVIGTVRDLLGDRRDEIGVSIVNACEHPGHAAWMEASLQARLDAIRDVIDDDPGSPSHDLDIVSARLLACLVPPAERLSGELRPVVLAEVVVGAGTLSSGFPLFDFRHDRRPIVAIFPTPPERELRAVLDADPGHFLANLAVAAGRMADDPLTGGLLVVSRL